jgi:hypothetical protein
MKRVHVKGRKDRIEISGENGVFGREKLSWHE